MAEIKWHDSAREHLRKIFDFNYNNMSEKYAYTILGEVLDEVQGLESAPRKGAPELLLEGRSAYSLGLGRPPKSASTYPDSGGRRNN